MSELALTLVRLAFLGLLWAFVLLTVWVLRRDIRQPEDSTGFGRVKKKSQGRQPKPPKPPKISRK